MRRVVGIAVVLLFAGCQGQIPLPHWQSPRFQDDERTGVIVRTSTGERISAGQLVSELAAAELVLLGEKHDNPDHHALQLWLLQAMEQKRPQGSVVFEMLTTPQQALAQQVQQEIVQGREPQDLAAALEWNRGWDWQQYRELLDYSVRGKAQLLAGNLTRDALMQIYRAPPPLDDGLAAQEAVQDLLHEHIFEAHCGKLPEAQVPAMVSVQQQRDLHMARALLQGRKPAVLIAGAYHVRKDMGVPLHLQDLQRQDSRVVIFVEAGPEPEAHSQVADYLWFTPATQEKDYCADLQ